MSPSPAVFHLELHTGDLARACALYERLCGWRSGPLPAGEGTYWALGLGGGGLRGGGVVESATPSPLWLPYVRVDDVHEVTARAHRLGARVVLEPREGPAGWRSVVAVPAGGPLALWQAKDQR
jgi:predicted enzyme related to lactoylglutathione lyase